MKNLGLSEEGAIATIQSVTLPSATFIQLQPQSVAFLDISNPKAVLEQVLRKYPTLTKGSTILFHYNDKEYYMKVLEVKPQTSSNAVSILNADVEVDFAPPVGYVEPERPRQPSANSNSSSAGPNTTHSSSTSAAHHNGGDLDDDPLQTSYSSFTESSSEQDDFGGEATGPKSLLLSQLANKKKPKLLPIVGSDGAIELKPESEVQELRESQKKAQREREEKARKEEEERAKKVEESKKNRLAFSGKGDTIR